MTPSGLLLPLSSSVQQQEHAAPSKWAFYNLLYIMARSRLREYKVDGDFSPPFFYCLCLLRDKSLLFSFVFLAQ